MLNDKYMIYYTLLIKNYHILVNWNRIGRPYYRKLEDPIISFNNSFIIGGSIWFAAAKSKWIPSSNM